MVRIGTDLKTVVLRTPVDESLDLKEAPLNEGAFLVSTTPPPRKQPRAGYLEGMGIGSGSGKVTVRGQRAWLPSRLKGPTYGPSGSSSATPNLAWNFGL